MRTTDPPVCGLPLATWLWTRKSSSSDVPWTVAWSPVVAPESWMFTWPLRFPTCTKYVSLLPAPSSSSVVALLPGLVASGLTVMVSPSGPPSTWAWLLLTSRPSRLRFAPVPASALGTSACSVTSPLAALTVEPGCRVRLSPATSVTFPPLLLTVPR